MPSRSARRRHYQRLHRRCAFPGCGGSCRRAETLCAAHYRALPRELQDALYFDRLFHGKNPRRAALEYLRSAPDAYDAPVSQLRNERTPDDAEGLEI